MNSPHSRFFLTPVLVSLPTLLGLRAEETINYQRSSATTVWASTKPIDSPIVDLLALAYPRSWTIRDLVPMMAASELMGDDGTVSHKLKFAAECPHPCQYWIIGLRMNSP